MAKYKPKIQAICKDFDEATKVNGVTMENKKTALETSKKAMAPILADMKEAVRRIKAAGFKPSKATDTDTGAETRS